MILWRCLPDQVLLARFEHVEEVDQLAQCWLEYFNIHLLLFERLGFGLPETDVCIPDWTQQSLQVRKYCPKTQREQPWVEDCLDLLALHFVMAVNLMLALLAN